jgi:CyaY protein
MMSETEFLDLAESTLDRIEAAFDRLNDEDVIDVECKRSGNVLEVEFIDNGSKLILNSQAPMQELWVAAKAGGYHYKRVDGQWINTRDGSELFAAVSALASAQGGAAVTLSLINGKRPAPPNKIQATPPPGSVLPLLHQSASARLPSDGEVQPSGGLMHQWED